MHWIRIGAVSLLCAIAGSAAQADARSAAARWDFGTEETTPLTVRGAVQRDMAGPVPPEFPNFSANNTAVHLDGQNAMLIVPDSGPGSLFDFSNSGALTVEAWVLVEEIRDGQAMYVIGKGRSNAPNFPKDNQNWALRVMGAGDQARLSFLFATAPRAAVSPWHRWTSDSGFHPITGWHHIAVAYEFGKPESVRGWIDGVPTAGTWDMGGATTEAPVVDDDEIWIGSSLGGNPGNTFNGALDAIALYRTLLDDATMASHFERVGGPRVIGPLPELMPDIQDVPAGRVVVSIAEGMPAFERWLNEGESWPDETTRWLGDAFLLPRIPVRYDAWGIRSSWKAPVLVRLAADVAIPPGKHRILVRARALGRLWVDGALVARTEALVKQPPNGEEPITPIPETAHAGMRLPGYRMQEVFGDYTVAAPELDGATTVRVVFETVAGGKDFRTETGEIVVALETEDGQFFNILQPASTAKDPLPLADAHVTPALAHIEAALSAHDDQTRRTAAASRSDYWQKRHAAARDWIQQHPSPAAPAGEGIPAHPVDAFIEAKITHAREAASSANADEAAHFHENILPILREACFRCHGNKEKGGLRLNSREALLGAGDSEIPAVVPGNPESSELLNRIRNQNEDQRMPPTGNSLPDEQIALLEGWIANGAPWPAAPDAAADTSLAPLLADAPFLRRVYLDTLGVPPSADALAAFVTDTDPDKRNRTIDALLANPQSAEHAMSDWLDMLAENPTIINASLNSTGPFRWFLYEALRDEKPLDRMVTELIMMRGAAHEGGSAGFALAAENDAPFAEKGHILASSFLGIEMQCARCHDAPYHRSTQRDLFSLAAMLQRKAATAPASSSVPAAFFAKLDRPPLIRVTLKPGELVEPVWPFSDVTGAIDTPEFEALLEDPADSRARLAALLTAPQNERFAQVMVNRLWKRLMGAGIVEPIYDWEGHPPSHPELLTWLARELVANDYDLRHVTRLILTSQAYQREARGRNAVAPPEQRYFNAPERRRLTAEQVVDSLHEVAGVPMDTEELTFVYDGRRDVSNRLTLQTPTRAWMFASLANERDRPSLALPRAQTIVDVLAAFGWSGSRQKPVTHRETDPNVLQPGVLANGTLSMNLTRAAEGSALAQWAIDAPTPEVLVNTLFSRVLNRMPDGEEHAAFSASIAEGFETRLVPEADQVAPERLPPLPLVTWFNHLQSEANTIQQENEQRVRQGPPPDRRLRPDWRERYEDLVWGLVNHHEFVWLP